MEDPHKFKRVVSEHRTMEEAEAEAASLKVLYNTPEEIESTWTDNNFHININSLSEEGRNYWNSRPNFFDNLNEDDYIITQCGDIKVYTHKQFHSYLNNLREEHPIENEPGEWFLIPMNKKKKRKKKNG
jgi:hypothetical protein